MVHILFSLDSEIDLCKLKPYLSHCVINVKIHSLLILPLLKDGYFEPFGPLFGRALCGGCSARKGVRSVRGCCLVGNPQGGVLAVSVTRKGPRITRTYMSNCIRALCNTNVARGFNIGKDVSVPVTYVRSGNEPTRDIGGKSPSERDILAFFAGQMHGYVRPLLLQYWGNKTSDMKIFGPMQRDVDGKAVYRKYMKTSKFCICARGYGVHTPRVVESIFYECVPVIISDNYVPPFFDMLDWETFAVFVLEKDIPNLRNILLSIPEDTYFEMYSRVKMVQQHFIWHKVPEKYDLFHMILHSIWYRRVLQMWPT